MEGEEGGGGGGGALKSRNIKAFPAAELSHVRGPVPLVPSLGEAAGPGAAEGILKRGRLPGILGRRGGGPQPERFVSRQVLKPCPPRRGSGQKGPLVSRWAGGQAPGPPSYSSPPVAASSVIRRSPKSGFLRECFLLLILAQGRKRDRRERKRGGEGGRETTWAKESAG